MSKVRDTIIKTFRESDGGPLSINDIIEIWKDDPLMKASTVKSSVANLVKGGVLFEAGAKRGQKGDERMFMFKDAEQNDDEIENIDQALVEALRVSVSHNVDESEPDPALAELEAFQPCARFDDAARLARVVQQGERTLRPLLPRFCDDLARVADILTTLSEEQAAA